MTSSPKSAEAPTPGQTSDALQSPLGGETCDVYLNNGTIWRNVPTAVWELYIGGYQVIKKCLSYRERELLGRALRGEEAREVINMGRRLFGLVLLRPALDASYLRVKSDVAPWPPIHA